MGKTNLPCSVMVVDACLGGNKWRDDTKCLFHISECSESVEHNSSVSALSTSGHRGHADCSE